MQQIPRLSLDCCREKNARFVEMGKREQAETCLCEDYHFLNVLKVQSCPNRPLHTSVASFVGTVVLHCAPAFVELGS